MKLLAQSHEDENPCPEDIILNPQTATRPDSNSPNAIPSKFMQLIIHSFPELGWFFVSCYVFLCLAFLASVFSWKFLMDPEGSCYWFQPGKIKWALLNLYLSRNSLISCLSLKSWHSWLLVAYQVSWFAGICWLW